MNDAITPPKRVFDLHPRQWRAFRYVYPVVSRRSKGLSIGINLNPDKVCNFDCIYCEVDRREFVGGKSPLPKTVDVAQIEFELRRLLEMARSGAIWHEPDFSATPPQFQRLNDIAFSGDGEPTTSPVFPEVADLVVRLRDEAGFAAETVKVVVITNATRLRSPAVEAALLRLSRNTGEVWAKLDAGTDAYYRQVDRTTVPLERIVAGIRDLGRQMPLVIQSLFMRIDDQPPPVTEIAAYVDRLRNLVADGTQITLVQVYTVARPPAESNATALREAELDDIAAQVRALGMPVETYR